MTPALALECLEMSDIGVCWRPCWAMSSKAACKIASRLSPFCRLAKDNLQKGDKREAILQAALELIAQHGLQHTPMSLISKHSKASAGVIYHYFESKDDLLQSLYCRIKGDMGRAWLAADDPQQPLAKRFQSLLLA